LFLTTLRLQPNLDKAADGLGAAGLVGLFCGPGIDCADGALGPAGADLNPLTGSRAAAPFFGTIFSFGLHPIMAVADSLAALPTEPTVIDRVAEAIADSLAPMIEDFETAKKAARSAISAFVDGGVR